MYDNTMLDLPSVAQVQRWLRLALEALAEAERTFDPEIQVGLRSVADDYLSLAQHAEAKIVAEALNTSCAKNAAGSGYAADHQDLAQVSPASVGDVGSVAAN